MRCPPNRVNPTLQALAATGDFELAKQTLRLLKDQSLKANGNGRIVHEVTTNGVVSNPGNTQETAQFILTVSKLFQWTGDLDFAREMYPAMKMGINWLLTDMDENKDLFPEGYGIMEVKGLNAELIDVAVYTQQALEAASKMAALFNETSLQHEYQQKASILKDKINKQFWDEAEGSYCDFYGSREQALSVAKGALEQLYVGATDAKDSALLQDKKIFYEKLVKEFSVLPPGTERGWFTNKN